MPLRRFTIPTLLGAMAAIVVWRTFRWVRAARSHEYPGPPLDLLEANRKFYNELWSGARLVDPERFNTWPLVQRLLPGRPQRLEVGPGLRPRLPIAGTEFIDASPEAVRVLQARHARAAEGVVSTLPFASGRFDLVCALDIVEHVKDGGAALAELSRVTKPGGIFLISVPLHQSDWTRFDDFVGHGRRYDPADLARQLEHNGFKIERSAAYGMKPRSAWLSEFGMRCLLQRPKQAMWYYTHLFMPLGLWFQAPLRFATGMIDDPNIDEVLLVCRKREN